MSFVVCLFVILVLAGICALLMLNDGEDEDNTSL